MKSDGQEKESAASLRAGVGARKAGRIGTPKPFLEGAQRAWWEGVLGQLSHYGWRQKPGQTLDLGLSAAVGLTWERRCEYQSGKVITFLGSYHPCVIHRGMKQKIMK